MEGRIRLCAADSGVLPSGAGAGWQWQRHSIRGADATPNRPGVHTGCLLAPRRYKGVSFKLERVVAPPTVAHVFDYPCDLAKNRFKLGFTKFVDVEIDAG